MPKARSYSRYLFQERHRKQYVLTKTKLIVGFGISLLGSIFVGSYFERYGPIIIHQTVTAIRSLSADKPVEEAAAPAEPLPQEPQVAAGAAQPAGPDDGQPEITSLENRVKNIQFKGQKQKPGSDPGAGE